MLLDWNVSANMAADNANLPPTRGCRAAGKASWYQFAGADSDVTSRKFQLVCFVIKESINKLR